MNISSRLRAAGKLSINKLQIIQQKESAISKQHRRQLSQTMAAGKIPTARIKAETIIASDIYVELLELLELYCELIVSRAGLLEPALDKDQRLAEAVHCIIYAAPVADVKELASLRELFLHVLNKDVVLAAVDGQLVPEQIVKRVNTAVPSDELVTLYLSEIAKAYQVNVPGIYEVEETQPEDAEAKQDSALPDGQSGASAASGRAPAGPGPAGKPPNDDLWERFNNLKR